MLTGADKLKLPEAAVVARVDLRDVHRAIDEHILSDMFFSLDHGRHILAAGCPSISFYFSMARRLSAEERLLVIRKIEPWLLESRGFSLERLLKREWKINNDLLSIDFAPFVKGTVERLDRLEAARSLVEVTPDILGGTPVIRGTRIPVYDIAASLAANIPAERILSAYPALTRDTLELAGIYAEANPLRGRPRANAVPEGSTVLSDRRIPRLRKAG